MPKFRLVSFNLCPFVQRSAIVLREKNIPHEIDYIDLADRPQWFTDMSPLGKVPLLDVDGQILFESAVIAEYLDEATEGTRLLESDLLAKARQRMWIEFSSALTGDVYMASIATEEAATRKHLAAIRKKLERLEAEIQGPYFGAKFSLVDCAFAPPLQRLHWLSRIAPDLELFDGFPKTKAWTTSLLERPSVQASVLPNLEEINAEYLAGKGSPARNEAPSWISQRAT